MAADEIPTLTFEGVKVSMHQTKDGIKITLAIHPNDVPADLVTDPIGSRYRVVMVLLDDDEQPKPRGNDPVRTAALLAQHPHFQQWVSGITGEPALEANAAQFIRDRCHIQSRAELASDKTALHLFGLLRLEYSKSIPER